MKSLPRWWWLAWSAWVLGVLIVAVRPFLWHVHLFHQVDPKLYLLLLVVLLLGALAATVYHFVRRRGFWRLEPAVVPLVLLLLCGLYAPRAIAVTLWILVAAWAAGRQLGAWLGIAADFAISVLAGLALFSSALFFLGISGVFRTPIFAALFAVPFVALPWQWRGLLDELRGRWRAWREDTGMTAPHVSLAVFAALGLALLTAAMLLTPVWEGDGIRFHLALARAYLLEHSVAVPPAISYGYYPQGFEVLAAAAYALGGQVAAQCLNPAFFCLALWLVYRIARICGLPRSWAVAGVVLGASVPFVHFTGSVLKNDLAMAAYELAALVCYFAWREDSNFRWILCGAFFIAASFSVKHPALFGGIPLGLIYVQAIWRQPKRLAAAVSVLVVLGAFGLFWQTRTYVMTGSPLTPMSLSVASPAASNPSGGWNLLARWFSIPYHVQFDGKFVFASPSPNPVGIVLLMLAPLWLIPAPAQRQRRREAVLWLFVLVYYLYWCLTGAVLRFMIAPVLLLVLLGTARLAGSPRWLALAAMTAALLFAAPVLILIEMAPAQIPLFLRQIDAATFLRRTLPPYGAVEFLAKHAKVTDHIASLGDWAVAYAPNPANFVHFFGDNRQYQPSALKSVLRDGSRYLILPNSSNLAELKAAAERSYALEERYRDANFVVYALTRRNRGSIPTAGKPNAGRPAAS